MGTLVIPEWVIQIATIISDLLVALAAMWGIRGLNQWRLQLRFGDQYKIAHTIKGLFLRFGREFALARHQAPVCLPPMGTSMTWTSIMEIAQDLADDFAGREVHMKNLSDITEKLYNDSIEVEGYLGKKVAGITLPLEDAYGKLFLAFDDYKQLVQSLKAHACDQETLEKFQTSRNIMLPEGNDFLAIQVNAAIEDMEGRLRRYLK